MNDSILVIILAISAYTYWVMCSRYFGLSLYVQTGLRVSRTLGYLHINSVRLCICWWFADTFKSSTSDYTHLWFIRPGWGEGHHLCYNIVDNGTRHNTSRINILTRGNYICRLWWFIFWYTHLSIWIMCVCYTFQRAGESNSSELHFVLWEFFKILKYSFYVAII